ncbi:MAG: hypothetical protein MK160_06305 [Rhodobacteraceae bacterium]|nr:hypothetical protein [Paracoccaceae bacterium]
MSDQQTPADMQAQAQSVPADFVYDTEHPVLPIPFKVQIGKQIFEGTGLSVTSAFIAVNGPVDTSATGRKMIIKLQFDFEGFTLLLFPEATFAGSRQDGEATLQFTDPTGAHLPQLRYILNNFIAGDFVTLGSMMSYTGPTKPKAPKAKDTGARARRVRSLGTAVVSAALILLAGNTLISRFTTSFEARPVFIERAGNEMRATTAGQVAYLNPQAKAGEVVFSINANTGDVLNFQLPCDCEVTVTDGVSEGSTVLPIDPILTFFDASVGVQVRMNMSVEGLSAAMSGDRVTLELSDGRSIPVTVKTTSATNSAALRGELYVPVNLVAEPGVLSEGDIGAQAQVRISKTFFGGSLAGLMDTQ